MSLEYLLNDEYEDEILAQVQEESLRHFREFELPRIQNESLGVADDAKETPSDAEELDQKCHNEAGKSSNSHVDPKNDSLSLCTQVGGKTGALLYEGEQAKGFHLAAGTSYIYPTNFPIRQYQAAMVQSALFKNTLVSLPTGLGKTFIAAVVMYNFYRWFPRGKVVFMAPTRPLVAQQIKACYTVMGIPPDDTTEMTVIGDHYCLGVQAAEVREKLWLEKRVFFLTPQVMANDLRSNTCPADLVKCLVIDEAHKAVKDYAYCQVVKSLGAASAVYRTLALSATPGNDINAVIQVIRNLNICCLEMRGEDSIDVAPYTHGKSVEQVVVDLSPELIRVKDDFMQVYERFARSLIENRALTSNIAFLSKFQILKAMEKFRANPPRGMSPSLIGSLVSDFTMCMTFAHALELLQIYGLRAFYRYLADDSGEKSKAATTRLRNNDDLQRMLRKLHDILYPKPGSDVPYIWGHPKLKKLVTSLSDHFKVAEEKGEKTKAIVFCNYKIVVNEIVDLLGQCKPHIQAALFVGQSGGKEKGMPQAKQLQIMNDFRGGKINCLVATCVAEEGLDIGEVDLIVLMESQKSPVRLVQRLGRTGRKRRGCCIVLLTRGKEESKFHEAMASRKSYVKNIVDSKAVKNSLCQYSPPMFPPDTKPQQQLVHIKVITTPTPTKPVKPSKKQMDIRECAVPEERPFLDEEAAQKLIEELGGVSLNFNRLPSGMELWHRRSGPTMNVDELFNNSSTNSLASWNDWNIEHHKSFVISNTTSSGLYCHILSYSPEKENPEYLELVKDFEAGGALPTEEANPSKKVAKVTVDVEDRKIAKKKIVPKKNYGMDIRSCMAVAVERANKKPRVDFIDDDIIVVDNDDCEIVGDLQVNVEEMSTEMRCSPVYNAARKPSAEKPPTVVEDRIENQLDIAAMFGMKGDDFENLLYGGELLCGLENDIDMCFRLGKFMGDPKHNAPKPKCMDVEVFRFQCDQFLSIMDGVREIPLVKRTVLELEPDSYLQALKCPIRTTTNSPGIHDCRNSEPGTQPNNLNESFVGIDDLFGDDEFFHDVDQKVFDLDEHTSSPKRNLDIREPQMDFSPVKTPPSIKTTGFHNIGEISPIAVKGNNTYSSAWGSNSVFAGPLTPLCKANSSKPIVSSTPINPNHKKKDMFSLPEEQPIHEKEEWLLDDILEEEEEMSKVDDKTEPMSEHDPPLNSSRDLFSSPPAGKVFQKSKVALAASPIELFKEPVPKAQSDFEEDFWCMDDLFDDDKPEVLTNRDSKDETTFFGITQMVSQIERDKKKNRQMIDEGEVIEILDSPSCSPIRNVCEDAGLTLSKLSDRETTFQDHGLGSKKHPFTASAENQSIQSNKNSPLKRPESDLKTLANQTIARVAIEKPLIAMDDFVSSNNDEPKSSYHTAREKPTLESVPISDLNGSLNNDPQPSTSKGFENLPSKCASTNVKDTGCHSLLDEDDDIFNSLVCDVNFVGEKNSEISKNPDSFTKCTLNVKKFKQKNSLLLSHLDSEPDNDFPPEKRNLNPAEMIHLKVGSLSKRKLSFEDMLDELDDSTTSKYFASSKTTAKQSNIHTLLSDKSLSKPPTGRKPMAVTLQEEDDIFIRPGQRKSAEGEPSHNESSSTSSRSSSPVKKTKKRKKKGHAFIEREAEESGVLSSDDSDNSSLDQMDDSFVDDDSDQELSYAHYLKSVKSPVGGGKFRIPVNKRYVDCVYSQLVNDPEEDYENDSFCVDSYEEHSGDEATVLELAERKLAKRKHSKKRIVDPKSDDTDVEDRAVDLESTAVVPRFLNKQKRRFLESDSDHTPERVPVKRPRNGIASPIAEETIPRSLGSMDVVSKEDRSQTGTMVKQKTPPADIPKEILQKSDPPLIRLRSDSDEELQEAIKRSILETKAKTPEELQFEEDLQKALLLSQCEVKGPSTFVRNAASLNPGPSDSNGKPGPSGLHTNAGPSGLHRNPNPNSTSLNSARRNLGSYSGSQNLPPSFIDDGGTSFLFTSQPILKDWKPLSTKPKVSKPPGPNSKKSRKVFELSDDSN